MMAAQEAPSILTLASHGKASDVIRDMRTRSLWSPYYFVKVVLGYNELSESFHLQEMERFVTRWATGARKQGIEWSRGFFKTTCYTIGCGIWGVLPVSEEDTTYALHHLGLTEEDWIARTSIHDQDATQLLAFETIGNSKKKLSIIKWHFEENTLFRTLFPEIAYQGTENPWNNECLRIRRVGARKRDAEGTFEATGVGVALQSRHYSRVWEDDLVGEKARKSTQVMEDTIGWHARLAGAFEDATQQTRFLVSNRWGYADLNSYVRANEPDFVWHTRSALEINPDSGEYEPVFAERFDLAALDKIKHSGSMTLYDFSCQFLNSPILPGEKEVSLDALHYYRVEEDGKIVCETCKATFYASQLNRYVHYDPYNAKGGGSTSCPALVAVGSASDGHVFLLDSFTSKENYGKIYDKIFKMNDVWRPTLFTYEDVGHQNHCAFHIGEIGKTAEYKEKHKKFCRMQGVTTGNRSKEVRVREGLFPVIEKKKFAIRKSHTAFLKQLETFPHKQFDHDYDLLDALSQGANLWKYPESTEARDAYRNTEDEYLRNFNQPYGVAGTLH